MVKGVIDCQPSRWPCRPGAIGRPEPGPRVARFGSRRGVSRNGAGLHGAGPGSGGMARGKPSNGPLSVAALHRRRGRQGWESRPSAPPTRAHRVRLRLANGFGPLVGLGVRPAAGPSRTGRWHLAVQVENGALAGKRSRRDCRESRAIAAHGSGCSTTSHSPGTGFLALSWRLQSALPVCAQYPRSFSITSAAGAKAAPLPCFTRRTALWRQVSGARVWPLVPGGVC